MGYHASYFVSLLSSVLQCIFLAKYNENVQFLRQFFFLKYSCMGHHEVLGKAAPGKTEEREFTWCHYSQQGTSYTGVIQIETRC